MCVGVCPKNKQLVDVSSCDDASLAETTLPISALSARVVLSNPDTLSSNRPRNRSKRMNAPERNESMCGLRKKRDTKKEVKVCCEEIRKEK